MDKKKYYVSVQSRTIMERQDEAAYELVIEATPEEANQLRDIFSSMYHFDMETYFRMHYPGIPEHYDYDNDMYARDVKDIYQLLYKLGTGETREHIETMNVLD
ncbi:hypothetical protein MUG84_11455 [Paenibacillus sp. KQZ6P-2]|uniref:Hydrolase n=1 Tax=Paenibacillus mangrovi TaxID=2931978 RepID=A0A9X2B562_9BACL|nr:hypothetical protein [Paenibacillus mangrovi]MCJ8012347.1 hypothetical protein [Paenibacillus mangrovi]